MKIFTCIIILCSSSVCPYSSNDVFPHIGSFDRNRVVVSLRNTWLYPIYYAGGSSQEQTSNLKECVDHNVFSSWLDHPFPDSNYLVQPSVVRLVKGDKKNPFMFLISPGCGLLLLSMPNYGNSSLLPTKFFELYTFWQLCLECAFYTFIITLLGLNGLSLCIVYHFLTAVNISFTSNCT